MAKIIPVKKYMSFALKEAYAALEGFEGGPFGCCIVRGREVISAAHNTVLKDKDPTAHAEINAIRQAARKLNSYLLSGCFLYTTTEPCPMCFSAIHWARISAVFYGTGIEDVKRLGFNELPIRASAMKRYARSPIVIRRLMRRECLELLKRFFESTGKRVY